MRGQGEARVVRTKGEYEIIFGRDISDIEYEVLKRIEEQGLDEDVKKCPCEYGICDECECL